MSNLQPGRLSGQLKYLHIRFQSHFIAYLCACLSLKYLLCIRFNHLSLNHYSVYCPSLKTMAAIINAIDPMKPGKFPVILGDDITSRDGESGDSLTFVGLRCKYSLISSCSRLTLQQTTTSQTKRHPEMPPSNPRTLATAFR